MTKKSEPVDVVDVAAVDGDEAVEAVVETAPPEVYVVLHSQMGQWPQGTEVTATDLDGIDVQRLLDLGAIEVRVPPRTTGDGA